MLGRETGTPRVVFTPDGESVVSGPTFAPVKLWRVRDGTLLRTLDADIYNKLSCVAISPDGQILAEGTYDREIRLVRVADGQQLHKLTGHSDMVLSMAFSPDGRFLAAGLGNGKIWLWGIHQAAP